MTVLLCSVGVALLILLAADLFSTVFHPEGHGGPLTRAQARLVWRIWRTVAPRRETVRNTWLSLGGPALAILTPVTWALLLVCGFALVYYPWITGFLVSPGSLRAPWSEALYFSGFAAATLGTGDIVPDLPALRLLTVVEALCGFALLSASLSYVLAIYREHGRKATLASELALHYAVQKSAGGWAGSDHLWLYGVAREILHVTNAHAHYPILHYFRPRNGSSSLTLQIAPLLARAGGFRDAGSAGAELVIAAVDRYLEAADTRFVPDTVRARGHVPDRRYERLLEYLCYEQHEAPLLPVNEGE